MISTIICAALMSSACNLLGSWNGDGPQSQDASEAAIMLRFNVDDNLVPSEIFSKASSVQLPDTNAFLLQVTAPDGSRVYEGAYGSAPERLLVKTGTYNIKVYSAEFSKPAFDRPQWGDEQKISVVSGESVLVDLVCRQINSGVRLTVDKAFLTSYPSSVLRLKSDQGTLTYGYSERRTAYFVPGTVSLLCTTDSKDEVLLTRRLAANEILTINVRVNTGQSRSGLRVSVDTSRVYTSLGYVLGGGSGSGDGGSGGSGGTGGGSSSGKGGSAANAYTVAEARENIGAVDVWVAGYIVGGDLSSKSISYEGPFKYSTNLAMGPRSVVTSRESCISVQLPTGPVRDALNLVDNPSSLGRYVAIKGDIVDSYFGLVGLKNASDFAFK